jgi:hypothetical protein
MSGTEDSILNSIPEFRDGGSGDQGGTSTDSGGEGTTSAQPTQVGGSGGQTSAQPAQTGGTGGDPQQAQQGVVRRRHDGLVEVPNAENPNTRDLVDPISGRVVAKGGIERKIFEDGQRATRENTQLRNQLQQAQRALGGINEVTQEAVRLNVAPQDQVIAIRVMADFMRDPVKTLQTLVEEVKSKGYSIPFLEQGVTPGMDMAAIQRMIESKMAPITQRAQMEQQQVQARNAAQQQLDAFLGDNNEANENLDVLTEMLQAQPSLTLHDAYTKMIRWAHGNGLDWTRNLREQIAERHQQPTQQPTQQPVQQRPIPGRRSATAGAQPQGNGSVQQFSENSSWADIIRQTMQENGVTLN